MPAQVVPAAAAAGLCCWACAVRTRSAPAGLCCYLPADLLRPAPSACRPGLPLCVYLLRYDDSFEMDRYQAAVARERQVHAVRFCCALCTVHACTEADRARPAAASCRVVVCCSLCWCQIPCHCCRRCFDRRRRCLSL